MKILNGLELAGYIKERQAKQVRGLRQALHTVPRLAIIQTIDSPVINSYVRLKQRYAEDILAEVDHHVVAQKDTSTIIEKLNNDPKVHGIILQLPLADPSETDALVNRVAPAKDVDGLHAHTPFDPATAMAIHWLLNAYNVELAGKKMVIIGRGKLVGAPLEKMWRSSDLQPQVLDASTPEAEFLQKVGSADVIVSATGKPGVLTSHLVKPGAVVVDAGVATEGGKLVGDVAPDVRARTDIIITPEKGGVGPLTVCALFENVIRAARVAAEGLAKPPA